MPMAWLALGANIGDPAAQLEQAIVELAAIPEISLRARSSIIVTAPWGKTDQPGAATDPETALRSAIEVYQETGAQAVKLEGGRHMAATVERLSTQGIAVMGLSASSRSRCTGSVGTSGMARVRPKLRR